MNSNWFSFDEDLASGFIEKSKVEDIKKNFRLNSKKIEKTENWSTASEVNDILDLATAKCDARKKSKLLDTLLQDRLMVRNTIGRASRFSEEPVRMRHMYADDFFSDIDSKITKIKSKYASDRSETESQRSDRKDKMESKYDTKSNYTERSPSCGSTNSYGFTEVTNDMNRSRKDSIDSSWSRKSCQGNVNFPSSSTSTLSEGCGGYSAKTIGRSISRDSDDSVCTEKSVNSSTISEKLPDGTDKTQIESNESWLRKSTSGSKIAEKKLNDITLMEKNDDGMCEKSTTKMSYLEKSATGSSLQEEITSEKVTSSGRGGTKTIEQKTSSETFKKSHKTTPNKSAYYDDFDSCSFEHFAPPSFSKIYNNDRTKTPTLRRKELYLPNRGTVVSEKISKLIDEAVQQDDLFKIPSALQTDIDKMTDDFFNSKSFGRDRTRTQRRLADLFSEVDKDESYINSSKITKLKSENDSLQQENLKLQSIIQDVTAVNKRWQKYNNERRLYVQKLLSTIQDLQEQINLISEKSAFQRKSKEEIGSQLGEIERLKKEHQEQITVLELQIKSHKDDWDAERKEKKKALQEKEELESKVHNLMRGIAFLKEALQDERHRKNSVCMACKNNYDQTKIFKKMEFCPPTPTLKVSNCSNSKFCTAVHIPYNTTDIATNECYYDKGGIMEDDGLSSPEHNPYFAVSRNELNETFSSDRFSRTTKSKSLAGDTVVVEDESGIRLAITEQFPSNNSNLKSILKKGDKKNKSLGESFSQQSEAKEESKFSRNRIPCSSKPNITCEECSPTDSNSFNLSVGFQNGNLAQVTSFIPDAMNGNNSIHYLSIGPPQLLNVGSEISRSKSEPNTRSNSSENLKPLRESSSWNSQSFNVDAKNKEGVICPSCDTIFPPSLQVNFPDHFELCQTENNQF